MDVGASLIAFITIGVQSAKIIFDTLSAIKDGPEVVARATRDVQRLGMILKALEPSCSVDQTRGEELHQHLQECIRDLARYETKLGKLTICDKERRLGKLWKKVKTAIGEKDLSTMHTSVASHIAHLNLYLQVRQFDASFELRKEVQVLAQTFHTNHSDDERRETATFGRLSSIDERLSSVDDVLGRIRSSLDQTSNSAESEEIFKLVGSLADQFTKLSTRLEISRQVVEVGDEEDDPVGPESHPSQEPLADLQRIISRLCDLVNREMARMSGQQSFRTGEKEVLDVLLELVDCIRSQAHQAQLTYPTTNDLLYDSNHQEYLGDLWNQLKRLYGALLSTRTVSLNPLGPRERKAEEALVSTKPLRLQRLTQVSYDAGFATLDIITSEKSKRPHDWTDLASCSEQHSFSEGNEHEESYYLSITPKQLGSIMKLGLKQYHAYNGTISGIPVLEINRMVPNGSLIFDLVAMGKVSDLQTLLIRGQASLRDHDEHGASLLQYASWNLRSKMCRFLLDNGADTEHFAPIPAVRKKGWSKWSTTMKSGVYLIGPLRLGVALDKDECSRLVECYKILLGEGADPTISVMNASAPLLSAFVFGDLEKMKCFLDHGGLFVDVNRSCSSLHGYSPFLTYCQFGNFTTEGFQLLIQRGADIETRDKFGRTCLHVCLLGTGKHGVRVFEALVYLVRCGANIFWTDSGGLSVSETAYSHSLQSHNSAAGDIWDAVLAELGCDVSKFRHDYARRARYTEDYTPVDFIKLWQGKEELCPYFYDDDLPELCRQFQSGSLDEWRAPGYSDYDSDYYTDSDSYSFSYLYPTSDTASDTNSDDSSNGGALIDSENILEVN